MGANDKKEATFHPEPRLKERGPGIYTSDEFESTRRPEYPIKETYADDDQSVLARASRGERPWGRPHPIEKFTAPPETVLEHLDRLDIRYKIGTKTNNPDGVLYVMIRLEELQRIENPKEDKDGK